MGIDAAAASPDLMETGQKLSNAGETCGRFPYFVSKENECMR